MEYTKKGVYMQTELRAKFLTSRCAEKGNARDFLRGLRLKKEELAQVGVMISDEDYLSTIISSLPDALSNFASAQIAWTMQQTSQSMDANTLMSMLLQEAERQNLRAQRHKQSSGKGKEDEKDEALAVSTNQSSKGRDTSKVKCWNCGDMGHFRSKCPKPKKSKANSTTPVTENSKAKADAPSGTVNIVEEVSDEEGAWAAEELDDGSDGGFDWFDEAVEAEYIGMPELEEVSDDEITEDEWTDDESEDGDGLRFEKVEEPDEAFATVESVQMTGTAELYDSGCTNHISPYHDRFENFENIVPRHFCAANKQSFSTIGKGELVIDIPNGSETSQLRITGVLYLPKVSYTLVSVGRLDEAGFTTTFGGGKCVIRGPDNVKIGKVLRKSTKIYKVDHDEDVASAAEEKLTLEQFHRWMGHISMDVTRKLVKDGMITGIRLEYTPIGNTFFCSSCVYAKATWKSVPKMREGQRAEAFGGEVHSDLWGKSPVES